jgi:ADP-ribosylation factor protein 6
MGQRFAKSPNDESLNDALQPFKVLIMGLDRAGKTSFLYKLKLDKMMIPIQSIHERRETIKPTKDVTFNVLDLGGGKSCLPIWKKNFENVDGFFFLVDCNDKQRLAEAGNFLISIVSKFGVMRGIPVVVVANKQDLDDCPTLDELITIMNLSKLSETTNKCYVQPTSVLNGTGVKEAAKKLADMIKESKTKF